MDRGVLIEALASVPVARRRVEVVERKGLGHPDTICDRIVEAASRRLCDLYVEEAGRVLHHNLDKALLVAGASEPRLSGGAVTEPMRLILAGRATDRWDGGSVAVDAVTVEAALDWVRGHLRFVEPGTHLVVECAVRPGSAQLRDVFERDALGANDTSVGVGYAPLSETERVVLACERIVNGWDFKQRFPEAGEDVKVMGARRDRRLELTLAVAMVDRFLPSERAYHERKRAMRAELLEQLRAKLSELDELDLVINALDREGRGAPGLYLTVLGTSAEGADDGQVGRGNRVNGLIAFQRTQSLEAAAGKNPVSHVGKIYNLLAARIASRVHGSVDGVEEAQVLLGSRIGQPVDRPWIISVQLALASGATVADVRGDVRDVLECELEGVPAFLAELVRGGVPVC
jgi:S-adenosylmethionine synthetase